MSSPTDLPSHVRAIVDEIETEIGEEPSRAESLIEGAGRHEAANGRVDGSSPSGVERRGHQRVADGTDGPDAVEWDSSHRRFRPIPPRASVAHPPLDLG